MGCYKYKIDLYVLIYYCWTLLLCGFDFKEMSSGFIQSPLMEPIVPIVTYTR